MQYTNTLSHSLKRTASLAAIAGLLLINAPVALAASTLLVNTESFDTISGGDNTTDVELRFGESLNEKIYWDFETGRFEFTDDVHVQGNLTATGTIIADGAISTKADLNLNSDNGNTDAILTFGNDGGAETFRFNNTTNNFAISDDLDVTGNVDATGTVSGDGNFTMNEDNTAADAVLTFGSDGTVETLTFANGADRFEFSDDVYVSGSLEVDGNAQFDGSTLTIGDASGDAVTVNSAGWTFANDTSVALTGGVNGLNFDSNTLSIDAANNRVGIGNAAPTYDLDVTGSAHASVGLSSSGSLVWEGSASGANLWVSTFDGAGLTDCDLSTNKVVWDATNKRFACSTDLNTGTIYTAGQGLSLNGGNAFSLSASFTGTSLEILGTASGRIMHAQDELRSSGSILAHSDIKTRADLTINSDNGGADAVLTFGSDGTTENLTFQNSRDRFEFSDDVKVTGNLSGSTLTVDGTVTFRGSSYLFPGNAGASGSVLRTDGAGNLSWATGINEGSGDVLSLHPEYPNAIYYQSGSTFIGQLAGSGAMNAGNENTYQWTSTKAAAQDYWIATRIRVPDNFVRWDAVKSLQLRYRTKTATVSQNHITVRLLDTAGANVALSGNASLASTTFATASITGPSSAGTYTPGGFITVLIKLAASSSGQANAGFLTINWETKNP